MTKHIGSLIYGALLNALLRPLRWVVNAILSVEQAADNPMCGLVMQVVKVITGACFAFMQKILDLTGQIAFMQIAYDGSSGFCEAQKHALEMVFGEKLKWAVVEGHICDHLPIDRIVIILNYMIIMIYMPTILST